jgi:raffinose/stachyose/melibiose transport system substrate-binding protein
MLILTGCSGAPGASDGAADGGDVQEAKSFTAAFAQANDTDNYLAEMVEKYAEESGVDIEIITYPAETYPTQVSTQLQAGNAADLMVLPAGSSEPGSLIPLAEAGLLAPLSDASGELVPDDAKSQFTLDETVFGQPNFLSPVGLVFNPAAAAEVGMDEFPGTFEEILDACEAAREGDKSFYVLAGSVPLNNGLLADNLAVSRVYAKTPDWNEQRAAGDVTFSDTDAWRDTLEAIVEMNDEGCFQDGAAGGTFDSIIGNLGSGTSLAAGVPGAAATSINAGSGLSLNVQAFPAEKGDRTVITMSASYGWVIADSADNGTRAAVQTFLDWVAEPAQAQELADLAGAVPITGVDASKLPETYASVGQLLEDGDYVSGPSASWPNAQVYEALGTGVQGLLTGQNTVDDVLANMDAAWDK